MQRPFLSFLIVALTAFFSFGQEAETSSSEEIEVVLEVESVAPVQIEDMQEKKRLEPDNGFVFNGYARAGVLFSFIDGFNSGTYTGADPDGTGGTSVGATGGALTSANKWRVGRLGNEPDNYWEMGFSKQFVFKNNLWARFEFMLAQGDQFDNGSWISDNIAFRQAYVEGGGFSKHPEITYWAGKRYYHHDDIHITDLFYREYHGTGGGLKNIGGILEIAYFAGDGRIVNLGDVDNDPATPDIERKTIVHNVQGQMAFAGGMVKLNVVGQLMPNAKRLRTGAFEPSVAGFQIDGELELKPVTLVLQYGYGLGANIGKTSYGGQEDGDNTIRLLAISDLDFGGSNFALLSQAWIAYDIKGNSAVENIFKTSIVARPIYNFTDFFSLQGEAGFAFDTFDDGLGNAVNDAQWKLTLAPTLSFDLGAWARPQLRAFVTYNGWQGDAAREYAVFGDDVHGDLVGGVQAEIWF